MDVCLCVHTLLYFIIKTHYIYKIYVEKLISSSDKEKEDKVLEDVATRKDFITNEDCEISENITRHHKIAELFRYNEIAPNCN